jgi:hypothetical protein
MALNVLTQFIHHFVLIFKAILKEKISSHTRRGDRGGGRGNDTKCHTLGGKGSLKSAGKVSCII